MGVHYVICCFLILGMDRTQDVHDFKNFKFPSSKDKLLPHGVVETGFRVTRVNTIIAFIHISADSIAASSVGVQLDPFMALKRPRFPIISLRHRSPSTLTSTCDSEAPASHYICTGHM